MLLPLPLASRFNTRLSQRPVLTVRSRIHSHASRPGRRLAAPTRASAQAPVKLGIYNVDPKLQEHADHLGYRWDRYQQLKQAITQNEGGLELFSQGYRHFGINRSNGVTTYREWVPAAQAVALIGDFSGWQEVWLNKGEWGVWEVSLPDGPDGAPAIPHRSRVKVKMQTPSGSWIDRIPAWIRWATQEPGVMGAAYDGVQWDPPPHEAHQWRYPRPPQPAAHRIYEAHVGMSGEEPGIASYSYFRDNVLPRIKKNGYTTVQLMAIQEHAYYGSFGYHVTNPFAISSRCGTPDELKSLIDEAHRLGLHVLLDVVHSHISNNQIDGLAGFDMGQDESMSYFHTGERGYHQAWDSRCLCYGNWETLRYLLSNVAFWIQEYRFDGFRFDGVTSMLYWDHGIGRSFSGDYHEYFGLNTNVDACAYLMMANEIIHKLQATSIAEDVSGMPALGRPVHEGGLGFDYRLGMAIPDKWIELLQDRMDEDWRMLEIVSALCNRRYTEQTVAYSESHDQALVGDKTIAFRLMDSAMYDRMSTFQPADIVVSRGIALHKVIRAITMVLGGEAYLNFMGNEFGHPEWIDFPREGNNWSHFYCRRQWSLADTDHLRYSQLGTFDRELMELEERFGFLNRNKHQWVTHMDEAEQVIVAERGPLFFVFNFSPTNTYQDYKVAAPRPGKWRVAFDSDAFHFGGNGAVAWDADHFTTPTGPEKFNNRDQFVQVMSPSRTCVGYYNADEYPELDPSNPAPPPPRTRQPTGTAGAPPPQMTGTSSQPRAPSAAMPQASQTARSMASQQSPNPLHGSSAPLSAEDAAAIVMAARQKQTYESPPSQQLQQQQQQQHAHRQSWQADAGTAAAGAAAAGASAAPPPPPVDEWAQGPDIVQDVEEDLEGGGMESVL